MVSVLKFLHVTAFARARVYVAVTAPIFAAYISSVHLNIYTQNVATFKSHGSRVGRYSIWACTITTDKTITISYDDITIIITQFTQQDYDTCT